MVNKVDWVNGFNGVVIYIKMALINLGITAID